MATLRYAQENGGQRFHLVEAHTDGTVSYQALCGRKPKRRGTWRLTLNCPLGNACKRCTKVAFKTKEVLPNIGLFIDVKV